MQKNNSVQDEWDPEARKEVSSVKNIPKEDLVKVLMELNEALAKIYTGSITEINDLIFAGSVIVTEMLGLKMTKWTKEWKKSWKRRLLVEEIKDLRKDLS